jgi:hypothetical protein
MVSVVFIALGIQGVACFLAGVTCGCWMTHRYVTGKTPPAPVTRPAAAPTRLTIIPSQSRRRSSSE